MYSCLRPYVFGNCLWSILYNDWHIYWNCMHNTTQARTVSRRISYGLWLILKQHYCCFICLNVSLHTKWVYRYLIQYGILYDKILCRFCIHLGLLLHIYSVAIRVYEKAYLNKIFTYNIRSIGGWCRMLK